MAIRRRTVTGNIQKADAAWAGAAVTFRLLADSYTPDAQFPASDVVALADSSGAFSAALWCDDDGLVPTRYQCWLPDRNRDHAPSFLFDLSHGDGAPVDIFVLRSAGWSAPELPDPLYAVIESEMTRAVSGRRTVVESGALTNDDYAVLADSEDGITLALPPAASRAFQYLVKNVGAGLVILNPDGAETIDRAPSLEMASGDRRTVVPVAGGWETW